MIEGFKGIADALSKRTGLAYSPDTVRKAMARSRDALPVERFDGRVYISGAALDAWIVRRRGAGRNRRAA